MPKKTKPPANKKKPVAKKKATAPAPKRKKKKTPRKKVEKIIEYLGPTLINKIEDKHCITTYYLLQANYNDVDTIVKKYKICSNYEEDHLMDNFYMIRIIENKNEDF